MVDVTEGGQLLSRIVDEVSRSQARVVVRRGGVPAAAIISVKDLERFDFLLAERRRDFAILDQIGEAFKDVPAEEIEREVAKAIAEIREEDRTRERIDRRP